MSTYVDDVLINFGSVVISGTGVHSAPFKSVSDPLEAE